MRVLLLNYEYPPLGGGAGNATRYLLKAFSQIENLHIDLVTSSVGNFRVEQLHERITGHFLDINKKGSLHYQSMRDLLLYAWKSYWYSKKLISQKKYDLVHAFFGIPCGVVAMKLGLPYIVSLRGSDVPFYNLRFYWLDKIIFKNISRKVWENASFVIALSNDLARIAQKTSKKQHISVTYNGIDTEEFSPDENILSRETTINLLFVGRLIERKGLIYLLRAFVDLEKSFSNISLHIVGDGPLLKSHLNFVKQKKMENKINFYGVVNHDKVNYLYKKSHIFILPSLNEALGNVTQEALASGLPIITTDTGASELIDKNGYIVKKQNSKDLYIAIKKLINEPMLIQKMGSSSRQLALSMRWEYIAEDYVKHYKNTIN